MDAVSISQAAAQVPAKPRPVWWVFDSHLAWLVPLVFLGLAVLAIGPIDQPLAKWFLQEKCPDTLRHVFEEAEPFGNAIGAIVLVIILWRVDRSLRLAELALLLVCSLGAGLAANVFKLLFERVRPRMFSYDNTTGWDSFHGLFPPLGNSSDLQSFPSAHVASAFGLALALSLLYPRLKELFLTIALVVGLQRMECAAHFMSDTLAGAAVGTAVGFAAVKWHLRVWRRRARPEQVIFAARVPLPKLRSRGPWRERWMRPEAALPHSASSSTSS